MSFNEYNPSHQNQGWGFGGGSGWGQGQGQNYGQGLGQNFGLGQAAFGQQGFGGVGGWQGYGQQGWGSPWQRSFSQQDVGEIVRHLVPLLPLIVNQAQQPHAAFGYGQGGGFGQGWGQQNQGWGQGPRYLSQQDVHEVVRQILPALPQIVNALQGQHQGQYGSAAYGGQFGGQGPYGGQFGQGLQALFGGLGQAAYGNAGGNAWGWGGQRQLGQGDVGEIVRHLTAILPQVIGNLQAHNQQQRGA
jgi:hypothetical protein